MNSNIVPVASEQIQSADRPLSENILGLDVVPRGAVVPRLVRLPTQLLGKGHVQTVVVHPRNQADRRHQEDQPGRDGRRQEHGHHARGELEEYHERRRVHHARQQLPLEFGRTRGELGTQLAERRRGDQMQLSGVLEQVFPKFHARERGFEVLAEHLEQDRLSRDGFHEEGTFL